MDDRGKGLTDEERIASKIVAAIEDERNVAAIFNALLRVFAYYLGWVHVEYREDVVDQLKRSIPDLLAMASVEAPSEH